MDKIVDICDRIESRKQLQEAEKHRGKLEAIQKLIQCSSCHFRCAMCGHHMDAAEASDDSPPVSTGFSLCPTCKGVGKISAHLSYPTGFAYERSPYADEFGIELKCPVCKGDKVVEKVRTYRRISKRKVAGRNC